MAVWSRSASERHSRASIRRGVAPWRAALLLPVFRSAGVFRGGGAIHCEAAPSSGLSHRAAEPGRRSPAPRRSWRACGGARRGGTRDSRSMANGANRHDTHLQARHRPRDAARTASLRVGQAVSRGWQLAAGSLQLVVHLPDALSHGHDLCALAASTRRAATVGLRRIAAPIGSQGALEACSR